MDRLKELSPRSPELILCDFFWGYVNIFFSKKTRLTPQPELTFSVTDGTGVPFI